MVVSKSRKGSTIAKASFFPRLVNRRLRRKSTHGESFSVHGLSRIATGKPLEKVFWAVVVVTSLSIVTYATYSIVKEYQQYEIRTEIRVVEETQIQMPDVIICDPQYYISSGLGCRDGISMFTGQKCNSSLHLNISVIYQYQIIPDRLIHYVSQPNICARINSSGLTSEVYVELIPNRKDSLPPTELDLFFVDQATLNAGYGGESALNRLKPSKYQIDIFERKVYRRLESPYPSKCSEGENVDLIFPGKYTMEKCEESHKFRRMLKKCGTVLDPWKMFLKPEFERVKLPNATEVDINMCLMQQFHYPGPFPCPLQCQEVTYNVKEFLYDKSDNKWQFLIRYSPRRMTVIQERPNYPLSKVFSDIGGWLGLFVGMSLLSFVEIAVVAVSAMKKRAACTVKRLKKLLSL